ncbi:M1 family metallopeptidase [Streptomyces caniscabiei]|uniref:M1 family metallopeptidase n=1 Tax=Streptomyces caniscabiei TaxID=2746961 RepID=UPI0029A3AD96|nr:M1 family metallopeptidase [Streptomyces caniscabiei]MDX2775872.1 M1 family metallopeptidase [Streptomyces caniscabiei]
MQTVSRLITQFVPEHYQLSLDLEREKRTFGGVVTINGTTVGNATTISVHAKDLAITTVTVDGKEATFTPGEHDEIIIRHDDITNGRHIVVIAFNGTITDAMHGLYPCYYDHDGVKKELLATQFESHHAREVFPCIDEPEAKATFDVTLTTENEITVLGNMPIRSQRAENDRLVTTFATTPRMSTYLVAWVTGELHKKTAITKNGVEVNVWATPAQKPESLDFALDIARRTIDFFDEYFGVPYPLPKSDHVALPDFSSGAMENWGLVTYREVALLADPATTSISSKHYIATVVAHELSHQWFGNLVTMKWWNNLWLNESFATLMEYIAVDALHPEWNIWMDFSTTESIMALRRDSIDGVQPVQVDVHHPDEISTLFDGAIVYAKGARLLRMLQHYVGHEAFQTGLKTYFEKYKYQNTEGDDLWRALADASGKDIAGFMNTWISQPGYPRVSVTQDGNSVALGQSQFFVGPHQPSARVWPIPLNSSVNGVPELLDTTEMTVTLATDEPLRLNVGDTAHFITQYDHGLLARHVDSINRGDMEPLDRLQLLHEQTLLARGGAISSADLIPLLDAYKGEMTESVWDIISLAAAELRKFVEDDPAAEKKLRKFSGDLAREQYQRLGWSAAPNEDEADTKLRATIIGMMLYSEDPEVIRTAATLYETLPLEKLDPELRPLIITSAVRYSDDPGIIDSLIKQYKTTSLSDLQQDIAAAITGSKDPRILAYALDLVKDESIVRTQDVFRWFVWTIRNRYGRDLAWEWVQNNWGWIEKTFSGDKSYDDFPRYSASGLMNRRQLEEYQAFFGPKKDIPALSRVITMGISEIEGRVELIERDQKAVCQALREL